MPMGHVMAYGTTDSGARNGMVMGKVTTNTTNRGSFQTASGLRAGAHRSQRDDERENKQLRIHLNSSRGLLRR